MDKKRQRSENWLGHDKLLLKALIMEKHEAIENKNMDANSNTQKAEAWSEVQNCFNSMCKGGRRTIAQLKNQWGTIKSIDKWEKKRKMEVETSSTSFQSDNSSLKSPKRDPDDINKSDSDTEQVQSKLQYPKTQVNKSKKSGTGKKFSISSDDLAVDMMQCEQKCRRELHARQMENEAIKKENLLIKQRLLRKKIDYYEVDMSAVGQFDGGGVG